VEAPLRCGAEEVYSTAKTVTYLFESESEASSIVRRLEEAGVSSREICVFTQGGTNRAWESGSGYDNGLSGADQVADYLKRNGVPSSDARAYAEGVRRGHALVAVRCDDHEVDQVVGILDGKDTLDLDERQTSWRSEGWTGQDAGPIGAAGSTTTGMTTGLAGGMGPTETGSMQSDTARPGRSTASDREEVIPVAEEEVHVGKQDVNRGRVRIHSHVVEKPVEEQVTLRHETVDVERRPVSGESRAGSLGRDPFKDRTVEMEERAEEAVVSKEARVKEELVVKKDVEQRPETVSDTVRRTEVDVEDERGNRDKRPTGSTDRKR